MTKKRNTSSKSVRERSGRLVEPHNYLETQRAHKKWYNISEMGKQRGKPHAIPPKIKKPVGQKKHHLRKEK